MWETPQTPPLVFSISYGDDEPSVTLDYASRCNVEFQKRGVQGTSILFSSGDDGVGGARVRCTKFVPAFPASSPFVTAVGGTRLATEAGEETVNGLSGGGFSNYFARPAYQNDAVVAYLANSTNLPAASFYNASGRAYPDISALSAGFVVVVNLVPLPGVAGTSCSSPTTAAIVALLNDLRLQNNKSPLGFLNPWLYQLGAQKSPAFTDILSGNNPGCGTNGFPATVGWDPSGGWGSPSYAQFAKLLNLTQV